MKTRNPVALRHNDLPGRFIVVDHQAVPAHEKRGWVEAKSKAAKAAVEDSTSPERDATPQKENDK